MNIDENKLTELLSRVDILEIKLAEANERISELERRPRHVAAESNRPAQNRLDGFKPDEFKEFHGALFHRICGRYENTAFCETCKVPLENLGNNHLFKCPICRENVEFTPTAVDIITPPGLSGGRVFPDTVQGKGVHREKQHHRWPVRF